MFPWKDKATVTVRGARISGIAEEAGRLYLTLGP
jgi:hypothetical protein